MGKCSMQSKELGREELLNWGKEAITAVPVKEKGGNIYVRSVSGKERYNYLLDIRKAQDAGGGDSVDYNAMFDAAVTLIIMTVCDKEGNTLFTEDDREAIELWPSDVFDKVSTVAMRKNGIDADAEEDAEKN